MALYAQEQTETARAHDASVRLMINGIYIREPLFITTRPSETLTLPLSSNLYPTQSLYSSLTFLQLSSTTHRSYISLLQRKLPELILKFRRAPFTAAIYHLFIFYATCHNKNVY